MNGGGIEGFLRTLVGDLNESLSHVKSDSLKVLDQEPE